MTAVQQWWRADARRVTPSDPGDPYWANVVLLAPLTPGQLLVDAKGLQTLGDVGGVTADGPTLFGQPSAVVGDEKYVDLSGGNMGLFLFPDDSPFTLECWAWHTTLGGTPQAFCGGNICWDWTIITSIGGSIGVNSTNTAHGGWGAGMPAAATGVWRHHAFCRIDQDTAMSFVDGVSYGVSFSAPASFENGPVATFRIGGNFSSHPYPFLGSLREVRITRGVARYTAAFTPPSAPFPQHG